MTSHPQRDAGQNLNVTDSRIIIISDIIFNVTDNTILGTIFFIY